eukprot:TRINITY_DN49856_c0_g1_i1.p1 TRINITY_DN49856_c0_g1~~TRINITY_DN49856_c0_g1_i1.p1  ORF type:complete len:498 (+),score=70.75 TRINITY_DN49856_c0_g1_i1:80-1573(+)
MAEVAFALDHGAAEPICDSVSPAEKEAFRSDRCSDSGVGGSAADADNTTVTTEEGTCCDGDAGRSQSTPLQRAHDADTPTGVAVLQAVALRLHDFEEQIASRLLRTQRGFERRFSEFVTKASEEVTVATNRIIGEYSGTTARVDAFAGELCNVRDEIQALKDLFAGDRCKPSKSEPRRSTPSLVSRRPVESTTADRQQKKSYVSTMSCLVGDGVAKASLRSRDNGRRESSAESTTAPAMAVGVTATPRGRERDRGQDEAPVVRSRQAPRTVTPPSTRPSRTTSALCSSATDLRHPKSSRQYFGDVTERPSKPVQRAKIEENRKRLSVRSHDSRGCTVASAISASQTSRVAADNVRRSGASSMDQKAGYVGRAVSDVVGMHCVDKSSERNTPNTVATNSSSSAMPLQSAKPHRDAAELRRPQGHPAARRIRPAEAPISPSPSASRQPSEDGRASSWNGSHDSRNGLSVGDWSDDNEGMLSADLVASEEDSTDRLRGWT